MSRRIIPCLDTRDGRVVKGRRFASLRDAGDPVELAARYEADGADEIVLLDIAATAEERRHAIATVRLVRGALAIPLTVGGAIRSVDDAGHLLDAGADKIAVNSAALARPALIGELARCFGVQCITVSVDVRRDGGDWSVFARGGSEATGRRVLPWVAEAAERGAGEILLTSIDRDGTRDGYDLPLVAAVARDIRVPLVASGGARTAEDLALAIDAGADAVLAASLFHDGDRTVDGIKRELAARGVAVRP